MRPSRDGLRYVPDVAAEVSLDVNKHPNPRTDPAVKAPLQSVPRRENERWYDEFHDRGEGTLADGYSLAQLASAVSNRPMRSYSRPEGHDRPSPRERDATTLQQTRGY